LNPKGEDERRIAHYAVAVADGVSMRVFCAFHVMSTDEGVRVLKSHHSSIFQVQLLIFLIHSFVGILIG
jgi:hypothetical protein